MSEAHRLDELEDRMSAAQDAIKDCDKRITAIESRFGTQSREGDTPCPVVWIYCDGSGNPARGFGNSDIEPLKARVDEPGISLRWPRLPREEGFRRFVLDE